MAGHVSEVWGELDDGRTLKTGPGRRKTAASVEVVILLGNTQAVRQRAGQTRRTRVHREAGGTAVDRRGSTRRGASPNVATMKEERSRTPLRGWLAAALAGAAAPALALLLLVDPRAPATLALVAGPILAVGLMGVGMIAAASAGRLWLGFLLAVLAGLCLIVLARVLGMPPLQHPSATGLAIVTASISFAARGALFARASPKNAWAIALAVVCGEAAMLFTASVLPASLPDWLLALLPAQWASAAIQTALTGTGTRAASSALLALGGTAATTLLVAALWPRRWPYLLMFTAWLGMSALVWQRPPMPHAHLASAGGWPTALAQAAASSATSLATSCSSADGANSEDRNHQVSQAGGSSERLSHGRTPQVPLTP